MSDFYASQQNKHLKKIAGEVGWISFFMFLGLIFGFDGCI